MIESSVSNGEFRSGSEPMLWRPGLDRARLRRRMVLASLWPAPAAHAGASIGLIMLGVDASPSPLGWILFGAGLLAGGLAVLCAYVNYQWFAEDHRHRADTSCFLDRVPGEHFYCPGDFADMPTPILYSVDRIIAAVREVQVSPATAWLDARHLHTIHRVAWNTLRVVDQTRAVRSMVDDPCSDAAAHERAEAVAQLAAVDDALDEVLVCLDQAVLLVRAWESKLAELDLRARLRAAMDTMPHEALTATVRAAESVPEALFAYLTAARDVTNAGPFAWERL